MNSSQVNTEASKSLQNRKLYLTNEILGALALVRLSDEDKQAFLGSPRNFIASKANYDLGAVDVSAVMNQPQEVHLALPYYECVEMAQATELSNAQMEEVAGGEIAFFALGLAIGAVATTAVAAAATTGALIGAEINRHTYILETGEHISYTDYIDKGIKGDLK